MKNSVFTLLGIVFFLNCSQAQDRIASRDCFDVYFAPPQEKHDGRSAHWFFDFDDSGIYMVHNIKKTRMYSKYAKNLMRETVYVFKPAEDAITPRQAELERRTEQYMVMDDNLYEFYSFTDREGKTNRLFCRTISKTTMKPNADEEELFRLNGESYYYNFANAYVELDICPDGSKFLVSIKLPEEEDRYRRFRLMVFDRKFQLLWERDQKFLIDKEHKFMLVGQSYVMGNANEAFELSNDGHVLTWGTQDLGKEAGKDRLQIHLIKVTENKMIHSKGVKDGTKKWLDYNISATADGRLRVGGFYNNWPDSNLYSPDGAFVGYWDVGTEQGEEHYAAFPTSLKRLYWSKKRLANHEKLLKKGKAGLGMKSHVYRGLTENDDGSVILFGQVQYTHLNYSKQKVFTRQNILVVKIGANGNYEWGVKIPKNQKSIVGKRVSYELVITDEKMHFIFNDNIKNLSKGMDKTDPEVFRGAKDNCVTIVTIDKDDPNNMTRELAWTYKEAKGILWPWRKSEFDDKQAYFYIDAENGMEQLVRVDFK